MHAGNWLKIVDFAMKYVLIEVEDQISVEFWTEYLAWFYDRDFLDPTTFNPHSNSEFIDNRHLQILRQFP
jgi:hypothetical protein